MLQLCIYLAFLDDVDIIPSGHSCTISVNRQFLDFPVCEVLANRMAHVSMLLLTLACVPKTAIDKERILGLVINGISSHPTRDSDFLI